MDVPFGSAADTRLFNDMRYGVNPERRAQAKVCDCRKISARGAQIV